MVDETRESSILVFPFISALALVSPRLTRRWKGLTVVVLLSWVVHILLFPHLEDRYFVSGAAMIGLAALIALLSRNVETSPNEAIKAA